MNDTFNNAETPGLVTRNPTSPSKKLLFGALTILRFYSIHRGRLRTATTCASHVPETGLAHVLLGGVPSAVVVNVVVVVIHDEERTERL